MAVWAVIMYEIKLPSLTCQLGPGVSGTASPEQEDE